VVRSLARISSRLSAECASEFRHFEQRVGFHFAHTVLAQVILHVWLVMIRMPPVVERILTLGGRQVVDPCKTIALDEIVIEAETGR